jgi:hypothetical protein
MKTTEAVERMRCRSRFRARCGKLRPMRLPRLMCVVPCLVAACATAPPPADPIAAFHAQAASELSCPQEMLRFIPLGDETFGETRQPLHQSVEGCSMRVVYTATKDGYVMSKGNPHTPSLAPDHVDVR